MAGDEGRTSYIDLLVAILAEHEKTLSELVEKFGKIVDKLDTITSRLDKIANKPKKPPKTQ